MEFVPFSKIARLSREVIVTEKIDGTNAGIFIGANSEFLIASRTRWITPEEDNAGFARWAMSYKDELMTLGPGLHYGEWWGQGIQRKYGLQEKRFSLFNTHRWADDSVRPACCCVVPVLWSGIFDTDIISFHVAQLKASGSVAAPGFMRPEGVVIYHTASGHFYKKTIENDEKPKSQT